METSTQKKYKKEKINFLLSPIAAWVCLGIGACIWFVFPPLLPALHLSTYVGISAGLICLTGINYLMASRFQRTNVGEIFRGNLVGLSAVVNGGLIWHVTASLWLGGTVAAVLCLAASLYVSRRPWFHTSLGYLNWFLPLSWPVNVPGFLIFFTNLLVAPIGYLHPLFRPLRVRMLIHLPSCTFTQFGGLIRPIKGFSGLNMGNFIFINPGHEHLLQHEIGHLFSLAAMGSLFHYIGGIDEGYVQENYWEAYAEYLAESYATPTHSVISMWRSPQA